MHDFDISAARAKFPLPDDVDDVSVNRAQLAAAMAVSENTLTKWLAQGMPVETEGGNGKEYVFQLADCYAWRMDRDDRLRLDRARADQAAHQLALAFLNQAEDGDESPHLTAREIGEQADAEIKRLKAAQLRGELVSAPRMASLLEDLLAAFRNAVTTIPDFAEMEFGLGPREVDKLQSRCDGLLLGLRDTIEQDIAVPDGALVPMPLAEGA